MPILALLPIKTYLPIIVALLEKLCDLFNRHADIIVNVVETVWPGHDAEVSLAMTKVREACAVFQSALAALRFVQGGS